MFMAIPVTNISSNQPNIPYHPTDAGSTQSVEAQSSRPSVGKQAKHFFSYAAIWTKMKARIILWKYRAMVFACSANQEFCPLGPENVPAIWLDACQIV